MQIVPLESEAQLNALAAASDYGIILKHNTSCPISNGVLGRLRADDGKRNGFDKVHVLDLLENRQLSDAIAGRFGVPHQSPQVLLIKNGRCLYHEWGFDISADEIEKAIGKERA